MWITSDIPIVASSRTYNTGGRQYVPAIEKEKIYKDNKWVILPNITYNEEYRTNIGFVNKKIKKRDFVFNMQHQNGTFV